MESFDKFMACFVGCCTAIVITFVVCVTVYNVKRLPVAPTSQPVEAQR